MDSGETTASSLSDWFSSLINHVECEWVATEAGLVLGQSQALDRIPIIMVSLVVETQVIKMWILELFL